ncbi:MAG: DUF4230 domain-containing protein [Porphyromonas sp.]|uniref:DUF4230 domain-containing protein n=1 Tax=Porphyromonas sp. TaxID=1924944 RepID=UPI001A462EFE|nr:DUF4230 domain-containing protein [Porphyromonas sp.]MBL6453036.1 DUF4230 domain-containing protein [Porphyromonas sp.]
MTKWLKRILYIILAILLIVGTVLLWRSCSKSQSEDYSDVVTHAMTVRSIEEVLKLSTGELYQEIPMVDTIDGMVIAYVIQARTYIDFDIEQLPTQVVGDTLYVQLPPEEVTPHELGYQVVDVHALRQGFFKKTLSAEQENRAKRRIPQRLIDEVYRSGYIRNARQQAREELARFLSVTHPTVIVVDRYPDGVRDSFFADTVYIDHRTL